MNALTDPFKALWQRKLWPVAVLLVGALVAVPMVLAKTPTPAPAPAANAQANADQGLPATFVSAAEPAEDGTRRRVLGAAKDPFAPAELSAKVKAARRKAAAEKKKEEATASGKNTPSEDTSKSGGGESSAGGSADTPPVSAAPAPAPTFPKYSIKVRFGSTDDQDLPTKTVERLAVLPSEEAPVLVYRGVEDGGKVAVFELTGSVVAIGDGKCEPDPDACQILKLRAGETEFLTVSDTGTETDAQYQLELLKINQKVTTDKSESEALTKSKGAKLLSKLDRKPRYAFDPKTGTLHKVRTKLSRAARRASL